MREFVSFRSLPTFRFTTKVTQKIKVQSMLLFALGGLLRKLRNKLRIFGILKITIFILKSNEYFESIKASISLP